MQRSFVIDVRLDWRPDAPEEWASLGSRDVLYRFASRSVAIHFARLFAAQRGPGWVWRVRECADESNVDTLVLAERAFLSAL